jgi:hypothetical protein
VNRTFRPNHLFRNNGNGTFTHVNAAFCIGPHCCTSVVADFDNDGLPDLYGGRYLAPRKGIPTTFCARNGAPNRLYRNIGDGTFTDVTAQSGVGEIGLCLGTVWGDYDNDGDPDLYVFTDFERKTVCPNNGDGTLIDVTVGMNTIAYGPGMSASFADYDNDGKFDLYATHICADHAWFAGAPTVWRYMLNGRRQGRLAYGHAGYWSSTASPTRDYSTGSSRPRRATCCCGIAGTGSR